MACRERECGRRDLNETLNVCLDALIEALWSPWARRERQRLLGLLGL